jgi:cobalt/nickel transport system permease protein
MLPMLLAVRYSPGAGVAIEYSPAGLATASATGLRALGAISALIFLGVTTPVSSQIGILRRMHAPGFLLDIMLLTYRLLFLFDAILERVITAQAGRLGYRNLRISFRSGSLAIASLFIQTLTRAQAMERGLAARGYDGSLQVLDISRKFNAYRLATIVLAQGLVVVFCLAWKVVSHG